MSPNLTKESPWAARFLGWILERFPPPAWILAFMIYAQAAVLGRFLSSDGPVGLGCSDLLGLLAILCFFLMLRVFDEHKDYEGDMKTYPERVLMRGLITLDQLKIVGALAIAVQLGVSLHLDRGFHRASLCWSGVMLWAVLMAREFFVGAWLKKRLVLYAVSHMVIMPMMLYWVAALAIGTAPMPPAMGHIALLAFLNGALFELTRKTRGPEEEREGVDSYTSVWGITGAAAVILVFATIALGIELYVVWAVIQASSPLWAAGLIAAFALAVVSLLKFRGKPSLAAHKKNEAMIALFILVGYLILGGSALATRGFQWF